MKSVAASENECLQKTSGGLAVAQCYNTEISDLNIRLNKIYNSYIENIKTQNTIENNSETLALIEKSQLTWKLSSDLDCEVIGKQAGDNKIWAAAFTSQCLVIAMKFRISFLQRLEGLNH